MGWDDTYVLFISTAFDYAKHFLWNGLKIMGLGIVVHQIQLRFGIRCNSSTLTVDQSREGKMRRPALDMLSSSLYIELVLVLEFKALIQDLVLYCKSSHKFPAKGHKNLRVFPPKKRAVNDPFMSQLCCLFSQPTKFSAFEITTKENRRRDLVEKWIELLATASIFCSTDL